MSKEAKNTKTSRSAAHRARAKVFWARQREKAVIALSRKFRAITVPEATADGVQVDRDVMLARYVVANFKRRK